MFVPESSTTQNLRPWIFLWRFVGHAYQSGCHVEYAVETFGSCWSRIEVFVFVFALFVIGVAGRNSMAEIILCLNDLLIDPRFIFQVDKLDMLMEHIEKANHKRTCSYLTSSARYTAPYQLCSVLKSHDWILAVVCYLSY